MKKSRLITMMTALFLVAVLSVSSLSGSAAGYLGDVNGDGKVSTSDARLILRHAVKLDDIPEAFLTAANVDQKGDINTSDARLALRMAVELEPLVTLPDAVTEPSDPDIPTLPSDPDIPTMPSTEPTEPSTTDPTTTEPSTTDPTTTEPSTTDPTTTEPSTTDPTTTEPPTTEPPTTQPASVVDEECYIKGTMLLPDGNGNMSEMSIESAHRTRTDKGFLGKELTLHDYYYRSADIFPGYDVGMITMDRASLLSQEPSTDMYILNFGTKKYLGMSSSIAGEMDESGDTGFVDMEGASMSVEIYYSLDDLTVENRVYDGVEYQAVISEGADGSTTVSYLHKLEGRDFYEPAVIESYDAGGVLLTRLVIDVYDPDPAAPFEMAGFTGEYYSNMAAMVLGINYIMDFMESIGMNTSGTA